MGEIRRIDRHVPEAGEAFLAGGRVFIVECVEDRQADKGQSVFTVRGGPGSRWALRLNSNVLDGIKWRGEPLPGIRRGV